MKKSKEKERCSPLKNNDASEDEIIKKIGFYLLEKIYEVYNIYCKENGIHDDADKEFFLGIAIHKLALSSIGARMYHVSDPKAYHDLVIKHVNEYYQKLILNQPLKNNGVVKKRK